MVACLQTSSSQLTQLAVHMESAEVQVPCQQIKGLQAYSALLFCFDSASGCCGT